MSSSPLFFCSCSSTIPHLTLIQNKVKTSALKRRSSKRASRLGFARFVDFQKTLYALQRPPQTFISNEINIDNIMDERNGDKFRSPVENIRDCIQYPAALCNVDRVIQGYWVGPDIEDGWGYIEALVS